MAPLVPQSGGFEGLGSLLEQPKASGLPVLDREHQRAPRAHLDPVAAPHVGGVRDHDLGTRLRDVVGLDSDVLKRRPELVPERLALTATAIDTLERPSRSRPVSDRIGAPQGSFRDPVLPVKRFDPAQRDGGT
jgi:hypothetical protein